MNVAIAVLALAAGSVPSTSRQPLVSDIPLELPFRCPPTMESYPLQLLPFDTTQTFRYRRYDGGYALLQLRPGYVLSECELLKITNDRRERLRLATELKALNRLQVSERQIWRTAETRYQQSVMALEERLRAQSTWWNRHRFVIGLCIGMTATVATLSTLALLAH